MSMYLFYGSKTADVRKKRFWKKSVFLAERGAGYLDFSAGRSAETLRLFRTAVARQVLRELMG